MLAIITRVIARVKHACDFCLCDNRPMDTIGSRIKLARERKGWSQARLAERAGISQSTIGNIESGARQGASSLAVIADALEVTHRWLHTGDGPQHLPTAWPLSQNVLAALTAAEPAKVYMVEQTLRAMLDLDPLPRDHT
jgi:transcriptional regulator with XRE-family HTH domain